jgi:hypothetical protein
LFAQDAVLTLVAQEAVLTFVAQEAVIALVALVAQDEVPNNEPVITGALREPLIFTLPVILTEPDIVIEPDVIVLVETNVSIVSPWLPDFLK